MREHEWEDWSWPGRWGTKIQACKHVGCTAHRVTRKDGGVGFQQEPFAPVTSYAGPCEVKS